MATDRDYVSDFEQCLAEGKAEGQAEGKAQALLTILSARGLALAPAQRARILACRDLAQLDRWIARAVTAPSVAQALGTAPTARSRAPRRRAAAPRRRA
ncbi:MAG TPA: hypothetical protein VGQ83_22625, partial [Polyangia bacterium]